MNLEALIERIQNQWGYTGNILLLIGAVILGYILHKILFKVLRQWGIRSELSIVQLLRKYLYHSTRYVVLILSIIMVSPALGVTIDGVAGHILTVMLIAAVANLCIQAIGLIRELLVGNFDVKADNDVHARKVYTQFKIIERIAVFLIIIFAIAIALMTFDRIRQVGVSLLASAGIVGIIVGFAAQKSLGTLLAGIQIAIAQPIRIDDTVVIEGEWGKVEEITLTYVVLKLWDERRLIVPISYFIEKPFQNWTRSSTELIGAVFIYLDYLAPIDEMRKELTKILAETDLWDKRVSALQVTNSTDQSVEVRILASAANSGNTFNLRCLIRERMIQFLQKNYPDSLPRTRMELNKLPEFKIDDFNGTYVGSSKEAHG